MRFTRVFHLTEKNRFEAYSRISKMYEVISKLGVARPSTALSKVKNKGETPLLP